MVNSPEPGPDSRRPDPGRLLTCYQAAADVMGHLGWRNPRHPAGRSRIDAPVWTSHEALLLDYELPMVRRDEEGRLVLTSTHWPWIGERTRRLDGAHVALLSRVVNPVACKVGPSITVDELLGLPEETSEPLDRYHDKPASLVLLLGLRAAFPCDPDGHPKLAQR
jgi:3-deoxy-7-phosphoheptulonate synthase